MRRRPDDRDYTIAALQGALDAAHDRIRMLEAQSAVMAARMAEATERADRAEFALWEMEIARAVGRPDVLLPGR